MNSDLISNLTTLTELSQEQTQTAFLRFALGNSDSGLLPLEQLAEVLAIQTANILPVPEMPSCVLGIYNWRGKMLWLIDLSHLVGDLSLDRQDETASVMVIQINEQFLGAVVPAVDDVEQYEPHRIQPAEPGVFPQSLLPFLQGYLPEDGSVVLAPEAIARYPAWQTHRS
ncbi:MAG: chemotaxis protein CheW [Cyanophyceae cyanobacterium]